MSDEAPRPSRADRPARSRHEQAPASGGGAGSGGADGNLAEIMGQVARALQDKRGDVQQTLQAISSTAVGAIPGAEECTITYVTGRREVEPRAATGELPRQVDDAQNRLGEGPCLEAVWEEKKVRIEDMRAEPRWPRFAAEAAALGVLSALSFQLFVEGDNLGALNVYARSPHAFGEESEDVGLVFAAHAAVALSGARSEDHLRQALTNRDLIGQAKGILMERYKLTADQAFGLLARVSQRTNCKLVDIAERLAHTGSLPGGPSGR